VTSGGGAPWSRVKRRKGEGCWGWSHAAGNLERLPAHQDKEGLRYSVGSLSGELRRLYLGSPARLGREEVKGKRGEANWE
jgi:hypothetical protein